MPKPRGKLNAVIEAGNVYFMKYAAAWYVQPLDKQLDPWPANYTDIVLLERILQLEKDLSAAMQSK